MLQFYSLPKCLFKEMAELLAIYLVIRNKAVVSKFSEVAIKQKRAGV